MCLFCRKIFLRLKSWLSKSFDIYHFCLLILILVQVWKWVSSNIMTTWVTICSRLRHVSVQSRKFNFLTKSVWKMFYKNLFDTCSVRLPVRYLLHQYLTKFSPTFVLEQENMVYRIKQIQLAEGVRHYLTKCAFTSVLKQEVKAAKMPPVFLTLSFVLSK